MSAEALTIIGVVAGVVAALVAVITLVWQAALHRNSGRRVQVKSSYVIPVYDDMELHDDDFIQVEVTNGGVKRATVINYAVGMGGRKPGRSMFVLKPPVWATRLPAAVEPGGVPVRLLIPVSELRKEHTLNGTSFSKMVPWVELGDGRRVYSVNSVPIKT